MALSTLLQTLEASIADIRRPHGVALEWKVPTASRATIVTDPAKLALVLRSLVSNAFKFTRAGRLCVRLAGRGRRSLILEVADSGIGIARDELPGIFGLFQQLDGASARRHEGMGLGLYLVRRIVQQLGGTIGVESEPGCGSTFCVVLPTSAQDAGRMTP
jgi:signal transduction histidine kinase